MCSLHAPHGILASLSFKLYARESVLLIDSARHLSCAKFVILFMMLHRVFFAFWVWAMDSSFPLSCRPLSLFFCVRNFCRASHLVFVSSCCIVSVLCCGAGCFPAGCGRHRPCHSAPGDRPPEWLVPADDVVALGFPGSDRSHVQNMHASSSPTLHARGLAASGSFSVRCWRVLS